MDVHDFLLDEAGDIQIQNGDFVVGEATEQHIRLLLISEKGEWRQSPYVGAGIRSALLDDADPLELLQEIQKQMELDGMTNVQVRIEGGRLQAKARYK